MCGICGFTGFNDASLIRRMTDSITHRGRDDYGYHTEDRLALGFRRLSIIDLNAGNQPLSNERKTIWSVCNGEIYNFKEIREELAARGHMFHTQTDTEVLPHAYEEWGIDFIERLNGMFAFALWDSTSRSLYLVRDRLGIRPLHYVIDGERLLFASEVKSLLHYERLTKGLNYDAMDDFLTFRYIPGNTTFFDEVKVLEPAQVLTFSNGQCTTRHYWDFSLTPHPQGRSRGVQGLRSILDASVRRCLISDVPLGVYLSGGLDSSVVAALVKEHYGRDFTVFSHGFDGRYDELKYARSVARHLGLRQEEVFIKDEHFALLPEIIYHLDMPIANSDIIGFYLLAERASQSVKVILTGEGSDELFGSYVHQETLYYGYKLKRLIPPVLRKAVIALIKRSSLSFLNAFFRYPGNALDEAAREKIVDYISSRSLSADYFSLNSLFRDADKDALYTSAFRRHLSSISAGKQELTRILEDPSVQSIFNKLILAEFRYWLPTYHLMKEDKIAMAYCLESRYPYLDHTVVEFMAGVPERLKRKGLKRKFLLRKVAKGLIPDEVVNRQKGPILVPLDRCFDRSFDKMLREVFTEKNVLKRGYFHYSFIRHLIEQRKVNPFMRDRQLFALLTLELWHSIFIDRTYGYG